MRNINNFHSRSLLLLFTYYTFSQNGSLSFFTEWQPVLFHRMAACPFSQNGSLSFFTEWQPVLFHRMAACPFSQNGSLSFFTEWQPVLFHRMAACPKRGQLQCRLWYPKLAHKNGQYLYLKWCWGKFSVLRRREQQIYQSKVGVRRL